MKKVTKRQGKILFASRKLLSKTISQHYCCGYCSFKTVNFTILKKHMAEKHNIMKPNLVETKVDEIK